MPQPKFFIFSAIFFLLKLSYGIENQKNFPFHLLSKDLETQVIGQCSLETLAALTQVSKSCNQLANESILKSLDQVPQLSKEEISFLLKNKDLIKQKIFKKIIKNNLLKLDKILNERNHLNENTAYIATLLTAYIHFENFHDIALDSTQTSLHTLFESFQTLTRSFESSYYSTSSRLIVNSNPIRMAINLENGKSEWFNARNALAMVIFKSHLNIFPMKVKDPTNSTAVQIKESVKFGMSKNQGHIDEAREKITYLLKSVESKIHDHSPFIIAQNNYSLSELLTMRHYLENKSFEFNELFNQIYDELNERNINLTINELDDVIQTQFIGRYAQNHLLIGLKEYLIQSKISIHQAVHKK